MTHVNFRNKKELRIGVKLLYSKGYRSISRIEDSLTAHIKHYINAGYNSFRFYEYDGRWIDGDERYKCDGINLSQLRTFLECK